MIIATVLITFGAGFLFLAIKGLLAPLRPIRTAEELHKLTRPIHMPAVFGLLDTSYQPFLRAQLPSREYRRIEKARIRALIDYLKRIANNSAVIMRASQFAALNAANDEVKVIARHLAGEAMRTRVSAMVAISLLYVGLLRPELARRVRLIGGSYEQLMESQEWVRAVLAKEPL